MLNCLREENRCYYIAATLVSLGITYFMKKLFLTVRPKEENFKPIDLDTTEISKDSLEISNCINENSNLITKCESDHTKLASRNCRNHYETLATSVTFTERDTGSLIESDPRNLPLETSISDQEIVPSRTAEIVPSNEPTAEFDIPQLDEDSTSKLETSPSDDVPTPELEVLSLESSVLEVLPSEKIQTSKLEILPSNNSSPSQLEILPEEEVSTPEREISPSKKISTSKLEILPSRASISKKEILLTDFPTAKHNVLPLESLTDEEILSSKPPTFDPKTKPSDTTQMGHLPEGLPHIEFDMLTSGPLTSLCEMQPSQNQSSKHETSTIKLVLSTDDSLMEEQTFDITLRYAQELKQEASSKSSIKELSGKTKSIDSWTNSNTNDFPLDIVPLEMIYKVLPLNTR